MAAKPPIWPSSTRTHMEVFLGKAEKPLGRLIFVKEGQREFSQFAYSQWRLAPAFDLNPFPDKDRESKTWLSEDTGPITSIEQLLNQAYRFELAPPQAHAIVKEVKAAVLRWQEVATSASVGLQAKELKEFKPAFENPR